MTNLVISQVDEQHFRVSGELTRSSIGDEKGLGSQAITKHKTSNKAFALSCKIHLNNCKI